MMAGYGSVVIISILDADMCYKMLGNVGRSSKTLPQLNVRCNCLAVSDLAELEELEV